MWKCSTSYVKWEFHVFHSRILPSQFCLVFLLISWVPRCIFLEFVLYYMLLNIFWGFYRCLWVFLTRFYSLNFPQKLQTDINYNLVAMYYEKSLNANPFYNSPNFLSISLTSGFSSTDPRSFDLFLIWFYTVYDSCENFLAKLLKVNNGKPL